MKRGRPAKTVTLNQEQHSSLESIVRRGTSAQRDVLRANIALMAAAGLTTAEIASQLGVSVPTVSKWRKRACTSGIKGLDDEPRTGRPRRIKEAERLELIALACEPLHTDGGRSTPTLDEITAKAIEKGVVSTISRSHVHRILQDGDVHPHRVRMWLHSPDPLFREKVNEICELYHNPPKGAVVLSIDEKTGMQAIERKHLDANPAPGRDRRREFEYRRHGTQALIASLNVHEGSVLANCADTRTDEDLEAFMDRVAAEYPEQEIHVIWDNLNTHTAMKTRWDKFNERHEGRFTFHYTPVHASWVNQIELWFGILGKRCLRNASFSSKKHLRAAVLKFVHEWNCDNPQPFHWTFKGYPLQTGKAA